MILVSEADMFLSESLRILAERLSQSEIGLPLRQICYYSPPEEVGVFSTEINTAAHAPYDSQPILLQLPLINISMKLLLVLKNHGNLINETAL